MSELSVCFVSQQQGNGKWSSFRLSQREREAILDNLLCAVQPATRQTSGTRDTNNINQPQHTRSKQHEESAALQHGLQQ